MRYRRREDQFRVFELKEGKYTEAEPVTMRNTLFAHLYGADQAVLVRVDKPTGDDRLEKTRAKLQAICGLQQGMEGYFPLGSGRRAVSLLAITDRWCFSKASPAGRVCPITRSRVRCFP